MDSDEAALLEIVSTLADDVEQLNQRGAPSDGAEDANGTDHVRNQRLASLADVQVRAYAALIEAASSAETAERQIERLLSTVCNQPLYPATILDAAELPRDPRHSLSSIGAAGSYAVPRIVDGSRART